MQAWRQANMLKSPIYVDLVSKYTRTLTFQNLCVIAAAAHASLEAKRSASLQMCLARQHQEHMAALKKAEGDRPKC